MTLWLRISVALNHESRAKPQPASDDIEDSVSADAQSRFKTSEPATYSHRSIDLFWKHSIQHRKPWFHQLAFHWPIAHPRQKKKSGI
jgi:hypothetical protein